MLYKSVFIAVIIDISSAAKVKAGFGVAFGVKFYKLNAVRCEMGDERNIMTFCHGMVDGYEMFIFHIFDCYAVVVVCFFCFKGRQDNSAPAYNGFAR